MELHSKGSQISIFWFLAMIFGLAGVRFSNGITLKSAFFQNRINFFKNCNFIACAKTLLNTPHLGWCSAVNFWRNSTRLSGFLAVIFTSQWLLASRNHWGLRKAKNSLLKFIKSLKKFWRIPKNSQFYCVAKTLLNTPHLGWCSAVNFKNHGFHVLILAPKSLKNCGFPCFWRKFTKKLWFSMVCSKYTQKLLFSMLLEKIH